jgi:hypothetical protein
VNGKKQKEPKSGLDVIALGHWVVEAPTQVAHCDAFISIASHRAGFGGSSVDFRSSFTGYSLQKRGILAAPAGWIVRNYAIQLPSESLSELPTELSGTYARSVEARQELRADRHLALDRSLADTLLLEITNFVNELPEREGGQLTPIILLRGPLSPALRGRILYRTFAKDVVILIVSHEAGDVERMAANLPLTSSVEARTPTLIWHGPFPPLAVDQGSRYFVATRAGKPLFVVESPCVTVEPSLAREHWDDIRSRCHWFFQDGRVAAIDDLIYSPLAGVPVPLAFASDIARQECRNMRDEELGLAEFTKDCCEQPSYPPPKSRMAQIYLRLTQPESESDPNSQFTMALEHFSPDVADRATALGKFRAGFYKRRSRDPQLVKLVRNYGTPVDEHQRRG